MAQLKDLLVLGDTSLLGALNIFNAVNIAGTLVLSKSTDASGTAAASPALIVGGTESQAHIAIDANEIMAKGSGTTTASLYLNNDGGRVYIGSGGLTVSSGGFTTSGTSSFSTGHLYLTGSHASSSTSNTTQLVFGTSGTNHIAITANDKALVLNPTTSSTTNQIVLYLNQLSKFPSGIQANVTGNLTGTADKAVALTTTAVGSNVQPVYWADGKPVAANAYSTILSALSWSNRTLSITAGGTTKTGAIPTTLTGFASISSTKFIGSLEGTATTANRIALNGVADTTHYGTYAGIIQNSSTGPESGKWHNTLRILHNNADGYFTDIAVNFTGSEGLWFRSNRAGTIGTWYKTAVQNGSNTFSGTNTYTGSNTFSGPVSITSIINSMMKIINGESVTSGTKAGTRNSLLLYGTTYGNDAAYIKTAGKLSYGDPGPQLVFGTNSTITSAQKIALIYTDNDTIAEGNSLSLVSTETNAWFIAPTIKALTKFIGTLDGNAATASIARKVENSFDRETSNYKDMINFYDSDGSTVHQYIGGHNTGSTNGAIIINPAYDSTKDKWSSSNGLYVGATTLSWNGASHAVNSAPTLSWGATATIGTVFGTALTVKMPANPNTDSKVTQSSTETSSYRPVVLGYTADSDTSALAATVTNQTYVTTSIYAKPSTGALLATHLYSNSSLYAGTNIYLRSGTSGTYGRFRVATTGTAGDGTNSGTIGETYLYIGNETKVSSAADTGANNARGRILLYGTSSGYTTIMCGTNNTSGYTMYLPGANGQFVYHTNDTQIGTNVSPVYIAAGGAATQCSTPESGAWFGAIPSIGSDGVTEIGRYIDFHYTSASTNDYDVRIDCAGNSKNTLYLPAVTGQVVVHTNDKQIGSATQPVYIAASGAATACTAYSGLLTAFSSSANTLSLTVGGTTKTTTAVNSVSNTWANGTASAGPSLSTTVNGVTGTAVRIPVATNALCGATKVWKAADCTEYTDDTYALTAAAVKKAFGLFDKYHTRSYSTGLKISTGTNVSDMYVPTATASQAGVVSTENQTFAGEKTFNGNTKFMAAPYVYHNSSYRGYIYFRSDAGTTVGAIVSDIGDVTTIQKHQFRFRSYSAAATNGTATSGYYEDFCLPASTDGRTANVSYSILTTKSTVTTAQGGTGNTSYTANRLVWTESATKMTAANHYANSSKIGVNYTSEPSYNFYVNGTGHFTGNTSIAGKLIMTGNIAYTNGGNQYDVIRFVTGDANGAGIVIGGGGTAIFGSGESAYNFQGSSGANVAGNTETTYITSDNNIEFYTNCQTIGNRVGVILNTSRQFYPNANDTGSLGTSSYKWSAVYATTLNGAHNGNILGVTETNPTTGTRYSPLFIATGGGAAASTTEYARRANADFNIWLYQGTASAAGYSWIELGNATASGTAGNKQGGLRLYSVNTGYTDLEYANTTSNVTTTIPPYSGNLIVNYGEYNPTSATTLSVGFQMNSGQRRGYNNGMRYLTLEGTASEAGYGTLILGNSTATGTAANKYGALRLYSTSSGYNILRATSSTSNYTNYLPASGGTLINNNGATFYGSVYAAGKASSWNEKQIGVYYSASSANTSLFYLWGNTSTGTRGIYDTVLGYAIQGNNNAVQFLHHGTLVTKNAYSYGTETQMNAVSGPSIGQVFFVLA